MKNLTFISYSEEETLEYAKKFAEYLKPKDVIILSGDLGSGKTKFTQGILSFFGLDSQISSPTYTIVNEYRNDNYSVYHFDLYRLKDSSEFFDIGGEEYLEKGICIIEWGELIEDLIPSNYIKIIFSRDIEDENKRILEVIYNKEDEYN